MRRFRTPQEALERMAGPAVVAILKRVHMPPFDPTAWYIQLPGGMEFRLGDEVIFLDPPEVAWREKLPSGFVLEYFGPRCIAKVKGEYVFGSVRDIKRFQKGKIEGQYYRPAQIEE